MVAHGEVAPLTAVTTRQEGGGGPGSAGMARSAWLFILPFGIFYLLFLIWPVIYMLITSFFNTSLIKKGFGTFAGLANYQEMFTKPEFWSAFWHTIQFTIYTTPPLVILAFVFAVLANR